MNGIQQRFNTKRALIAVCAVAFVAVLAAIVVFVYQSFKENEVVLSPDLVVYEPGESSFEILSMDEDSVVVSSLDGIQEGNVLNAGITDATPDGMLRRLGAIEPVDGGFRIQTEQAALTDAIEECDISFNAQPEEDGTVLVDQGGDKTRFSFVEEAHAAGFTKNLLEDNIGPFAINVGNSIEGGLRISGATIEKMSLIDNAYAKIELESLNFNLADALSDGDIKSTLERYKMKVDEDNGEIILHESQYRIPVQAGPMHLPLVCTLKVVYSLEAFCNGVTLEAGASLDRSFGFEYTPETGARIVNDDDSQAPYFSFGSPDKRISMGVNTALNATADCLLYGAAGPELGVGLVGEADGILSPVEEGQGGEGAIKLPGIDTELSGRLNAKIYMPITGRLHVTVDKLFGFISGDLINIELFDTDDAVSLVDVDWRFGTVWEEVVVELGNGLRDLAFYVPDDWKVEKRTTFNPSNRYSRIDEIAQVFVTAPGGTQVIFNYIYGSLSDAALSHSQATISLTEVAKADFIPLPQNGNVYTQYDEFVVAEERLISEEYVGIDAGNMTSDETATQYSEETQDARVGYALVPKSWLGTRQAPGATGLLAFPYGGSNGAASSGLQSVDELYEADGGIAFSYIPKTFNLVGDRLISANRRSDSSVEIEISEKQRQTIIDILASLHVV